MTNSRRTSQFMSIEGLELVVSTWDCGCWHETGYDSEGIIQHLRFQACTECWESMGTYLDNLCIDGKVQLTLGLASERERGQDG